MNINRHVAAAMLAAATLMVSAKDINVRGIVTNTAGEPLQGVCIYNAEDNKLLTSTNEEGKYLVIIDSDGKLLFSILGSEETEVPVEGRLTLDVSLARSSITLDEVMVSAKSKLKVVAPEPTDIEIKGNYLHVKTRVKVPRRLFGSSTRLIIQPEMINVTRRKMQYMRPVVFDGRRYHITQERMYDYDISKDPLASFSEVRSKEHGDGDAVILYNDSVYVARPDEDFRFDMFMAMENYNRVFYRDTSTVARGVVNPLRFFHYSLLGSEVTDSAFMPTPEMQLRDTKGDVMLTFAVGKADLDMNQGDNRREMESLLEQLRRVENDPDAALKSFTIATTASPEGNYEHNLALAQRRMKSALDFIYANLSPTTRRYVETSADATVATWEPLVEMLRADSLTEEADKVREIVERYPDSPNRQSVNITRLPFYRDVIAQTYLPRLRRVSYEFVTSQYRYLTDEEIAAVYAEKPASLSRFEFFRLYRNTAKTPEEKEAMLRKALEVHPKFLVAATDLSALMLDKGEPDPEILAPFLVPGAKKIPDEARLNQIASCLATYRYHEADSLASTLPEDDPRFHKAKVYTDVFNGRYENAIQEVSAESPLNEVIMLLCLKANDQAWRKAQQLGGSANEEYIKAVAANRVDEYMSAINHIENAFRLDPHLREVAKVDGDLIELLEDVE